MRKVSTTQSMIKLYFSHFNKRKKDWIVNWYSISREEKSDTREKPRIKYSSRPSRLERVEQSVRVYRFTLSSRHPVLCRRTTGPLVRSPTSGSRGSRSSTFSSTSVEEKGGKRGRKRDAVLWCVWIALRGTRTCPMHALHPAYRTNPSYLAINR